MSPSPRRKATGPGTARRPASDPGGSGAGTGRLVVREIRDPADPALEGAYRLVQQAFHQDELVSMQEWQDTLAERDAAVWTDTAWHLLVAERGGRMLGVGSGTYLGNVNVGVMGYLVVHPDARGLGLGPRLRRRLRGLFFRDAKRIRRAPLEALVGEVRRDNPWLRRLIRRPTVVALDVAYYQPELRADESAVEFVLYYESFGRRRQSVPANEVRKLLYNVWRRVYRIPRPLSSPIFRRMMRSLARRRSIRQIKLRDLKAPRAKR
jgi:GNAT superfamily N-acetyltransferase